MGDVPTTDNKAADFLNGIISALMSGGESAAELYIAGLEPEMMAIPIVRWIVDEGVHYLAQIVSVAGQKFATQVVIDYQINRESSVLVNSATELAVADASGDQDAIQGAIKDTSDAYASLIHWDGSANPK